MWLISLWKRNAGIVDGFWGLGFVVLAWLYRWLESGSGARSLLVPLLVTAWGIRLSIHLLRRNWAGPEDYRYAAMRQRSGPRFGWVSLYTVFWLQAGIMWVVALPLLFVHRPDAHPFSRLDVVAAVCFVIGLAFEVVSDWQLARFRADPGGRGRVMDRGLWRYSRHPNYFGDALLWWGIFLFSVAAGGPWWVVISPALMTLLLVRVSGVPLLERRLEQERVGYRDYVERTSAFLPWIPRR